MTRDILMIADWMAAQGVTHVAMESTGVYSKPIFSYSTSSYRSLEGRRGKKRALIAVGHSILVILYYLLKKGRQYADLGTDFFDRLEPQRLTRYYDKRLQHLGHKVTLEPCATV
jgi:transposase